METIITIALFFFVMAFACVLVLLGCSRDHDDQVVIVRLAIDHRSATHQRASEYA